MKNKVDRLQAIKEIIISYKISSQEDLLKATHGKRFQSHSSDSFQRFKNSCKSLKSQAKTEVTFTLCPKPQESADWPMQKSTALCRPGIRFSFHRILRTIGGY